MNLRYLLILTMLAACSDDAATPVVGQQVTNNATNGTTNNSLNNLVTNNTKPDAGEVDMGGLDGAVDSGEDMTDPVPPINPIEGVGAATLIQEGFQFTEGPHWFYKPGPDPGPGTLRFTDIPASTIYERGVDGVITSFRNPSGQANGLASDPDNNAYAAEHETRRISVTLDGAVETLVDRYQGQRFNSPNDLVFHGDWIYFTDPPYGLGNRAREIDFNGLYRYDLFTQELVAEWEGDANDTRPNGVVVSPDGNILYMADTKVGKVYQFSIGQDGALSDQLDFADVPGPDGMAIDSAGNLYITASDGVQVFAPDGTKWGTITVARQPANCALGGADRKTLFITAREGLYSVDVLVAGPLD